MAQAKNRVIGNSPMFGSVVVISTQNNQYVTDGAIVFNETNISATANNFFIVGPVWIPL